MKLFKRFRKTKTAAEATRADTCEVYRDNADKWRWRIIAGNNEIIAASEQGYSSKYYARDKAVQAGAVDVVFVAKADS